MPNHSAKQRIALFLFCFLPGSLAFSQTASLSLSSGSAVEGGSVSLNLSLSGGGAPAGLQWMFSFAPSDVSSIAVTPGPALASAGKNLTCNSVGGSVTCMAIGTTDSTIGNCVVATVTVTLAPATGGTTVPIVLSSPVAAFANGSSETVSATSGVVTVQNWQPGLSSLQCSPTSLSSGAKSTCTVVLAQAAPSGGTAVTLSSNSALLPVAASVTVPAGSTSAPFTATAGTIAANQTATLTATLNGIAKTASINLVAAVQVSSLSCSPASLGQNSSSSCTITLNQAAPAGGASVALSSNVAALTVPASVTVAAGSATAIFSATSSTFSVNQTATVTATYNSTSATAGISLATSAQVQVSSLSCSPNSLGSNSSSTCTLTLTQAAPAGGASVALSSNLAAVTVAASVTVAAGSVTATFSAASGTILTNQDATVTATYNSTSATATICLKAPVQVSSLSCNPASLGPNSSSSCTVALIQAAPGGGASVVLSSNAAALTVPASVTVSAGSLMATFNATSGTFASNQTATVTATYNSTSAMASVSLTTPAQISSFSCSPTTLGQSSSITCTVMLTQAAAGGGASVALSSNAAALTVPASVTVAAGSSMATFNATSGTFSSNQTATLTATYNNTASASISLAASAPAASSLSLSSGAAVQGGSVPLNLTLAGSGGAPAGLQWRFDFLPSDVSSVVVAAGAALGSANKTLTCNYVSGSVTCMAIGATDSTIGNGVVATVTVTLSPATSGSTVHIMVCAPGAAFANGSAATMASTLGTVAVTNWQPGLSSLLCSPNSLASGAQATCTVSLAQAAPSGGTAVSLASNNSMLPIAASITVPAGSTSATSSATAGKCGANQTATVTATLNGAAKTSTVSLVAPVQVSTLTCSPNTLGQNSTSICTITLTQDAPTGGASVTLASNAAALTVPASVKVAAGASTATFSATSGTISSSQTATVTATYNSSSVTANISLSASAFISSLSCSPATLTSATSATCTVTAANGSQGQATLTSNNPLLTLPASVNLRLSRGALTASFTATAGQITASQTAIITASLNGTAKSTAVTLNAGTQPQVRLLTLACTPSALPAQSTGLCSITLGTVADGAAAQVRLSSSSAALQLPAVIATRPGQTSIQFQINSSTSAKDEAAVISAQLNADTIEQTVSLRRSHNLPVIVPASQVVKFGSELRFQVSAEDQSAQFTASAPPAGATFDGSTGVFAWTPTAAQQGKYRLAFRATNSAGEAGIAYSAVQVDAGEPAVDRVVNAASGSVQGACSPGAIARIEGRWLSQGEAATDPSGGSLELGGTSVEIEGKSVPILYASSSRIDILCPEAGPALSFEIVVRTAGLVSPPFETKQNAVAPGIFTVDGDGSGQGLVALAGGSKLAMVRNYLSAAEPARPGDRIVILATGIGAASNVLVRIGDAEFPAETVTTVAGRPGVSQITAVVPDGAAAGNSVSLSIVGQLPDGSPVSSNSVSVAIEEK